MKFFEAWRAKGVTVDYRSRWSHRFEGTDRYIFTVWNDVWGPGESETRFNKVLRRSDFFCAGGDPWINEVPGQLYIQHARECMAKGIPGEVITLNGKRRSGHENSQVESVDIMDQLYWLHVTRVEDDGLIEGFFARKGGR
ncbi:hypothetical protein [Variovorax sp. MHTC-1]|uniref:hypothetical protein n=1 Tax=Variovorax sp. MHTC-1 TaxID=2495593 RepID=UPI000F85F199|nr:hypothetical protein [Variovorax sp. MHTC-1]RST52642.1 hypothetical protein EJI01_15645 [Variovorax sp. MHTC-1]